MKKTEAIFHLWYDKLERMSYRIGDADGLFSSHDMKDFQALESLVYVSAGSRVFKGPANDLIALFEICNPNDRLVTDEDRKAYNFMLRRMNKLAAAISRDPITPPTADVEEEDY